jgi:Bacterial SH3 domain/Glycine zipper
MATMTRMLKASISLVVSAAMLAGCANGSGGGLHFPSSYAASDSVCRAQRQALANTGDTFLEDAITGAVAGAAFGALLSAATGQNVARGAAIGAGVGAISNVYLSNLQKQYGTDTNGMVVRVSGDITKENTQIQRTHAAFVDLMNCRRFEAQAIRDNYKGGKIQRADANTQLAAVRAKLVEDYSYADKLVAGMSKRGQQFEDTYTSIDPAGAAYLSKPSAPAAGQYGTVVKAANVRASASGSAAKIGHLAAGDKVQLTSSSGGWWQIVMPDGQPGFVTAGAFEGTAAAPPKPSPTQTAQASTAQPQQQELASLTRTNREGRQEFAGTVDQSKTQLAAVTQDVPASGQLSNAVPAAGDDNAG